MNYKRILSGLVLSMTISGVLFGASLTISPLGNPETLDSEVSKNVSIARFNHDVSVFSTSCGFFATPSNNVEIAFGYDADENGVLSETEKALALGWDCGNWFLHLYASKTVLTEADSLTTGINKKLSFHMQLDADEKPRTLSITDGEKALFSDVLQNYPTELYDSTWDMMRLTARGLDDASEHFFLQLSPDAAIFLLR